MYNIISNSQTNTITANGPFVHSLFHVLELHESETFCFSENYKGAMIVDSSSTAIIRQIRAEAADVVIEAKNDELSMYIGFSYGTGVLVEAETTHNIHELAGRYNHFKSRLTGDDKCTIGIEIFDSKNNLLWQCSSEKINQYLIRILIEARLPVAIAEFVVPTVLDVPETKVQEAPAEDEVDLEAYYVQNELSKLAEKFIEDANGDAAHMRDALLKASGKIYRLLHIMKK